MGRRIQDLDNGRSVVCLYNLVRVEFRSDYRVYSFESSLRWVLGKLNQREERWQVTFFLLQNIVFLYSLVLWKDIAIPQKFILAPESNPSEAMCRLIFF